MADQNSQYMAMLTAVGEAKLANATALGVPWNITQLGVGDANGAEPMPSRTQTALINERRRAPINQLSIDPNNPAIIIAEQVIPEDVGGWWIREIGLYDEAGALVAVANCPPTYKPELAQGSGRTQVVRLNILVSSTQSIQLKIDPSVVLATRKYVDDLTVRAAQADAEAGTDNSKLMTALRVWQAITKRFSTQAQAEEGADNSTVMTPLRVLQAMVKYGLGATTAPLLTTVGDTNIPTGLYRVDSTAVGLPIAEPGFVDIRRGGAGLVSQRYYSRQSQRAFFRRANGSLGAWEEYMHTGTVATQVDAEDGTNNVRWMTSLRVWQAITKRLSTQAQAEAGEDNSTAMTPLRVWQAITKRFSTQAQAEAGEDNSTAMTPLRVWQAITKRFSTQLQAEEGIDSNTAMTPLRVFQAIKAITLGVSQSWQNVTASRAFGVTYTNTTGRPIYLSVYVTLNSSSQLNLLVDGVAMSSLNSPSAANLIQNGHLVIPPGSTYGAALQFGSGTLTRWTELR